MITWRKSSHSDETGGHCVEVANLPDGVAIRDSKAPKTGTLTLTPHAFTILVQHLKLSRASLRDATESM
ncbi:DUF397 domain-containing protein [Spirillospora sp. NPDC048819]|uniref:DUF397 domain-containing protein n=1 Tax=Spirillospora sp. NPDC048819 TaxID=3155268 RepID=UPI0033C4DB74